MCIVCTGLIRNVYSVYRVDKKCIQYVRGQLCLSVCRYAFMCVYGAMDRRIDPSLWTHRTNYRSSQCSTTGVTKVVLRVILSVG